jgi:hypothetical protein
MLSKVDASFRWSKSWQGALLAENFNCAGFVRQKNLNRRLHLLPLFCLTNSALTAIAVSSVLYTPAALLKEAVRYRDVDASSGGEVVFCCLARCAWRAISMSLSLLESPVWATSSARTPPSRHTRLYGVSNSTTYTITKKYNMFWMKN